LSLPAAASFGLSMAVNAIVNGCDRVIKNLGDLSKITVLRYAHIWSSK